MAAPGQRLVADAQAARGGALAKFAEIRCGAIDAAERGRRNVAADQQQVGLQFLHQVELALGAGEIAGALRLGHALEIAERLERADAKPEIAAHPRRHRADCRQTTAGRSRKSRPRRSRAEAMARELFVERAAQ